MQRGRKSAEAVTMLPLKSAPIVGMKRPEPHSGLTAAEKQVWNQYVEAMPAGWFGAEMLPILSNLCRAVCWGDRFARRMGKLDATVSDGVRQLGRSRDLDERKALTVLLQIQAERFDVTTRQQSEQVKTIASLSTKLRLTPQSRYQPNTAGTHMRQHGETSQRRKPWEHDDDAA
jgi:hypothetical protein